MWPILSLLVSTFAHAGWEEDRNADIAKARGEMGIASYLSSADEAPLRKLLDEGPDGAKCKHPRPGPEAWDVDCTATYTGDNPRGCGAVAITAAMAMRLSRLADGYDASVQLTLTCPGTNSTIAVAGVKALRPEAPWHDGTATFSVKLRSNFQSTMGGRTELTKAWRRPDGVPVRSAKLAYHTRVSRHSEPLLQLLQELEAQIQRGGDLASVRAAAERLRDRATAATATIERIPNHEGWVSPTANAGGVTKALTAYADAFLAASAGEGDAATAASAPEVRMAFVMALVSQSKLLDSYAAAATDEGTAEPPEARQHRLRLRAIAASRAVQIVTDTYDAYVGKVQQRSSFGSGAAFAPMLLQATLPHAERARAWTESSAEAPVADYLVAARALMDALIRDLGELDAVVQAANADPSKEAARDARIAASVERAQAQVATYAAALEAVRPALGF